MVKSISPRLGQTRWSSGTDTVRRTDFDQDAAKLDASVAIYGQGTLVTRPAASLPGRFYMTTGESDPKLNGRLFYDNGTSWTPNRYMADATIESSLSTNTGLLVRGATGQTADILAVANNTGANLFRVTAAGLISNQASVNISGGVSLGATASHDAALSAISVDPAKPVVLVRGAEAQTAPLISARTAAGTTVFSVLPSGQANFTGAVTASQFVSAGSTITGTLEIQNSVIARNITANSTDSNTPSAIFNSFPTNPSSNTVDFLSGGVRQARITSNGSFITNGRVIVGKWGEGVVQNYPDTDPTLNVISTRPASPVARVNGMVGQSANLLEIQNNAVNRFIVDAAGNTTTSGQARAASMSVNGGLTQFASAYQPVFEVSTGASTGSYNEGIVVRHAVNDTNAIPRTVGLFLKLSGESSAAESAKYAGIAATSSKAFADRPVLQFHAGGSVQGTIDPDTGFTMTKPIAAPLLITTSTSAVHWDMSSGQGLNAIGVQDDNSVYIRGNAFNIYSGGVHSNTSGDAGANGKRLLSLSNGAESRLTVGRLTLSDKTTIGSTTPVFSIGTQDESHMAFTASSIRSYGPNNSTNLTLFLQEGGQLNLGDSSTKTVLPSRAIWFSSTNKAVFTDDTFGFPIAENDWWFDHTNNSIKCRTSTGWTTVA